MALTSLQVSMDTTDWFQGSNQEEAGIDTSPNSEENDMSMLACSNSILEKNLLKPQGHLGVIKCPRCDSTNTKFCYYNNYSLSQPRYFCKTCRRYWTKGGSLRNIPVGGGCRKNKRVSVKKPSAATTTATDINPSYGLQLSFPEPHLSHFTSMFDNREVSNDNNVVSFMEGNMMFGNLKQHDFMGSNDLGLGFGANASTSYNGISSHYGFSFNRSSMLPFDGANTDQEDQNVIDVKQNTRFLTLDQWGDDQQGCSEMKNSGIWNYNATNGYEASTNYSLM